MQIKTTTIVAIVLAGSHAQAAVMGTRGMAAPGSLDASNAVEVRSSQGAMATNMEQIVNVMNAALLENGMEALTAEEIMEAMSAAGSMQSKAARSAEILDSDTVVQAIKAITDLSGSTADILVDLQNGGSIAKAISAAIKNIKDIITMATKDVALIGGSSSSNTMFENNDQLAICDAFSAFVKVHQDLLRVIIGDQSLISKTPFTAPVAAALRGIEGIVDKLAFAIIGLVPTCAAQAKKDQMALDMTLMQAIDAYKINIPLLGDSSSSGQTSKPGGLLGGILIPGILKDAETTNDMASASTGKTALVDREAEAFDAAGRANVDRIAEPSEFTKPGGLLGGILIPGLLKSADAPTQPVRRGGLLGGHIIPGLLKSANTVDDATNTATAASRGLIGGLTGLTKPVTDTLDGATGGLTKPVSNAVNGIVGGLDGVTKPVTDTVGGVTGGLTKPVSNGANGGLTGVTKPVTDTLDGATGGLTKPVSNTVNGLVGGLTV